MVKKNVFIGILLAILWICQSCNIATTVHFNKNYSGSYKTMVDLSDLLSFAGMADSTGSSDQASMVEKMRHGLDSMQLEDKYNGMTGIRDAHVDVSDEGVISIEFKFDNVESLNASFAAMKEQAQEAEGMEGSDMDLLPTDFLGGGGGDQEFSREGKVITHSASMADGLGDGMMEGEDGDNMDMFSSMIDYTIDLSFDRKVKSVDLEGATLIEKGDNVVKTRVDFVKFMKEGGYSIKVKTK